MGAHITDKLHLCVYEPETNRTQAFISKAERSEGSVDVNITTEWIGKNLEVWAFFTDAEILGVAESISDTVYLGSVLLT
jgi:hypothetical protein